MIKNLQKPRAMRATLFILLLIVAGMTKAFAYSGTGDYFGTLDSQTSYYPDATVTANNCTFLMPNYDVDVVAEYAMNPPFTVSFNPGTGSCDIESLTETGSHSGVILPTATPSANCADHGYTFQGWAKFFVEETRVSPDLYSAGELYYPSENTTLFAVYAVEATDWREITELSEFMEGDYIIATEYNQNLYYLPFNGATSSVTIPKMKLNANGEPTTSPALQPGQPLAPTHLWTIAKMNDTQYSITHRQDSVTYYLKSYKDGVWSIQVTVYEPTSGWVMSQHSTKGLRLCFPNPQADPTKEVRYLDRGVSYWANHPDYDYVGKIHLFLSPSIAYCTAPVCMNVTAPDYITQYFTLESLVDDNTITFHIPHDITSELLTSVSYSTDGINWLTLTIDDTDQSIVVNLDTDEKVYFKGIGAQYGIDEDIDEFNNPNSHFEATGDFKAYGNTMSLFYGDDFYFQFHGEVISQLHFPSFVEEIAIEPEYVFCGLFYGNTHLVSAEHMVLPAVNLGEYPYCYTSMFSGCTSLTTAPELPATSLSEGCYSACSRVVPH